MESGFRQGERKVFQKKQPEVSKAASCLTRSLDRKSEAAFISGGFGKNDFSELKTGRYWEWGQGADLGPLAVRSEAASVDIWLPLLLRAPKPGHLHAAGVRQGTVCISQIRVQLMSGADLWWSYIFFIIDLTFSFLPSFFSFFFILQEPSNKRVKPLSRVTSLANLIPPVKATPLKRFSQTLQVRRA